MDRFERLVVLKLIKKLMILPISQEIETQDYAYNHSFKPLAIWDGIQVPHATAEYN